MIGLTTASWSNMQRDSSISLACAVRKNKPKSTFLITAEKTQLWGPSITITLVSFFVLDTMHMQNKTSKKNPQTQPVLGNQTASHTAWWSYSSRAPRSYRFFYYYYFLFDKTLCICNTKRKKKIPRHNRFWATRAPEWPLEIPLNQKHGTMSQRDLPRNNVQLNIIIPRARVVSQFLWHCPALPRIVPKKDPRIEDKDNYPTGFFFRRRKKTRYTPYRYLIRQQARIHERHVTHNIASKT